MNAQKKEISIFQKILDGIDPAELEFDDLAFSITNQLHILMEAKGVSQKQLADFLKCSEASVSKQLSGDVNLTLKTIAKYLVALSAKMDIHITDKNMKIFDIYNTDTIYKWEGQKTTFADLIEVDHVSAFAA